MVQYDPSVIQQFAEAMYKKARCIIVSYTLMGIVVGAAIGGMVAPNVSNPNDASTLSMILAVIGAFILGAAANNYAQIKMFHLKLTAQTALCQMAIEANTRVHESVVPHSEPVRAAA